jgi:hypothetical protein
MSVGNSIVSALAGGLLALGGLTYAKSLPPREALVPSAAAAASSTAAVAETITSVTRKAELRTTLRRLFDERSAYMRNAIISTLGNASDVGPVTARLMRNQDDIGGALKPYYGEGVSARLTALLKEQITLGGAVTKAAKTGEKARLAAARKNWADNGVAIAALLSEVNPSWQKAEMEQMLQKHIDLTMRDITARLLNDWPADIRAYDDGHQHMLTFADTLADGIARQFPAKMGS